MWDNGTYPNKCTPHHFTTLASICPLMRQAHQGSTGAFWYPRKGMTHRNINAHNSQQIKRDFVRRDDHTNYQLFIVCYCCHYSSLIIFGGQLHHCISSMWKIFPFSFLFLKPFIWLCHISCYGAVPQNRLSDKRNQHYITFGIISQIREITHTLNWLSKTGPAH